MDRMFLALFEFLFIVIDRLIVCLSIGFYFWCGLFFLFLSNLDPVCRSFPE